MSSWMSRWPRFLSQVETAVGAGAAGTVVALLTMVVALEVMVLIAVVGSSGRSGLSLDLTLWQIAGLGALGLAVGWISAFYAGRRSRS